MVSEQLSWCHQVGEKTFHDAILGDELPESDLKLVQIFFDTASFDEIERDKKIKFEAQLSLIGGTMGLLTGFSILSGIEIIYFVIEFFVSLRKRICDLGQD